MRALEYVIKGVLFEGQTYEGIGFEEGAIGRSGRLYALEGVDNVGADESGVGKVPSEFLGIGMMDKGEFPSIEFETVARFKYLRKPIHLYHNYGFRVSIKGHR